VLFHVTLQHTPTECPGRNPDKARASRVHFAEREARQRELGYQVLAFVGAWPSHLEYALVEAPDLATVHHWTRTFPNQDDATVTPVERMIDWVTEDAAPQRRGADPAVPIRRDAMLFHLTMQHSSRHCPGQDPELRRALQERCEQREQRATETGVQVQFFISAEPGHVTYALLAADSVEPIRRWLMRYPIPQDVTVTPVQWMADLLTQG
jgi:hypothetical protein